MNKTVNENFPQNLKFHKRDYDFRTEEVLSNKLQDSGTTSAISRLFYNENRKRSHIKRKNSQQSFSKLAILGQNLA